MQIFWIAGPTWLLAVTALLVLTLIMTDHIHPPRHHRRKQKADLESHGVNDKPSADGSTKSETSKASKSSGHRLDGEPAHA